MATNHTQNVPAMSKADQGYAVKVPFNQDFSDAMRRLGVPYRNASFRIESPEQLPAVREALIYHYASDGEQHDYPTVTVSLTIEGEETPFYVSGKTAIYFAGRHKLIKFARSVVPTFCDGTTLLRGEVNESSSDLFFGSVLPWVLRIPDISLPLAEDYAKRYPGQVQLVGYGTQHLIGKLVAVSGKDPAFAQRLRDLAVSRAVSKMGELTVPGLYYALRRLGMTNQELTQLLPASDREDVDEIDQSPDSPAAQ